MYSPRDAIVRGPHRAVKSAFRSDGDERSGPESDGFPIVGAGRGLGVSGPCDASVGRPRGAFGAPTARSDGHKHPVAIGDRGPLGVGVVR